MNYTPLAQPEVAATMLNEAAQGRTASQIVATIWKQHNLVITRNAVIGRLYRLGAPRNRSTGANNPRAWSPHEDARAITLAGLKFTAQEIGDTIGRSRLSVLSRMSYIGKPLNPQRAKAPNPAPRPRPREPAPARPEPRMIAITELTSTVCHWPIGDPLQSDFGFCGATKGRDEGSYCPYHRGLSVRPRESA